MARWSWWSVPRAVSFSSQVAPFPSGPEEPCKARMQSKMKVIADVCMCVRASFVRHTPLCTRVDKWVTDVSVETDSKWWKMCLQQFSELFSWERSPFSALEVIALSIKNLHWIWNFRQTLCEYTKPGSYSRSALSSTSAWRHRLES